MRTSDLPVGSQETPLTVFLFINIPTTKIRACTIQVKGSNQSADRFVTLNAAADPESEVKLPKTKEL